MGMLAGDMCDFLSSQAGWTINSSSSAGLLFEGQLPDNVSYGIGIMETGGFFSEHTMGPSPAGIGAPKAKIERPRFQALVRSPTYAVARARVQDIFNLCDGLQARTINGTLYQWVSAVQSPRDLGRNLNQQSEFSVNFDVMKAVSTSTA